MLHIRFIDTFDNKRAVIILTLVIIHYECKCMTHANNLT